MACAATWTPESTLQHARCEQIDYHIALRLGNTARLWLDAIVAAGQGVLTKIFDAGGSAALLCTFGNPVAGWWGGRHGGRRGGIHARAAGT